MLIQNKSEQLVVIYTEEYESKMESILQDRSRYCKVEIDRSQEFKTYVIDWADQYLSKGDIDDVTYRFITRIDMKPGNAYGFIKCHKEGRPFHIIAPECNTALENLSHWVRDQIEPLADSCKYRLQDTNDVIVWINKLNKKYAPFSQNTVLVSFDVVSMYFNTLLEHGLRAIRCKLLNRTTNIPSTECIVEVDDLLINFKFNNLALPEYGRYCDDTFTPLSHGLG